MLLSTANSTPETTEPHTARAAAEGPKIFPRPLLPAFIIVAGLSIATGSVFAKVLPGSIVAALIYATLALQWAHRERRDRLSLVLFLLGAVSGVAVFLEPGLVNLVVAWVTLCLVAIRQRGASFHDLRPIAMHLGYRALSAPLVSVIDGLSGGEAVLRRLTTASPLRVVILPATAVAGFAALLIIANPLIDRYMLTLPTVWLNVFNLSFVLSSAFAFMVLWPIFAKRSRIPVAWLDGHETPAWHTHYFTVPALVATLALLNALFALQNGLDLAFLWSGARLPDGLTHAEYVHRGAFTLIVTAILAGILVMIALWPGSPGERYPLVRWLVYAWIAQNMMLVASSAARTFAYIGDYGLTEWRLAGLIWMGLVAAGLALIVARIALDRTTRWLVNQNLIAVFTVLFVSGFVDTAAIVANHNVERFITDKRAEFDPDYVASLGRSAIPALLRHSYLARDAWSTGHSLRRALAAEQADWRTWTLRGWTIERAAAGIEPARPPAPSQSLLP